MMKRLISKPILCFFALFALLMASCVEKDYYDPTVTTVSPEATDLDFSTNQAVKMNLSYGISGVDVTNFVATFDLYTENPCDMDILDKVGEYVLKDGVKPIASGISISGGYANLKTLPGYVTELYAYSSNYFVSSLMYAKIAGGEAVFSVYTPPVSKAVRTRNASNGKVDLYLGQSGTGPDVDATGRPNYVDPTKQVDITAITLQRIVEAFPNEIPAKSDHLADASIYLEKEASVWITMLVSDGAFVNEFAYFCYDGKKEDLASMTTAQRAALKVISAYPVAKLAAPGNSYTSKVGEYVQLKYYNEAGDLVEKFPAGTTIGWVLLPKDPNGNYLGESFYSCPAWNPEANATEKNHTIYFNAGTEEKPFVCFGFEDMRNDGAWGYKDFDCNDMMFNVQLDPMDALIPPPVIEEPTEVTATETYKGYLGFEDYWPQYFDYDMNDLLVKYKSVVSTVAYVGGQNPDANVYITSIDDEFSMVFTGAGFNNKFGYKVEISPDLIEKVTLDDGTGPKVVDISNNRDLNGFIIDVCPGARDVIEAYDRNAIPKVYKVSVTLKDKKLTMATFEQNSWMAPYNPFITPISGNPADSRNGEIEVHLPGYMPTQRVAHIDLWFGKFDDRSNYEGNGLYYVGGAYMKDVDGKVTSIRNIYPFAIHLSGIDDFFIPFEGRGKDGKGIDRTYPRFTDWVLSEKTRNTDWYFYPDTEAGSK